MTATAARPRTVEPPGDRPGAPAGSRLLSRPRVGIALAVVAVLMGAAVWVAAFTSLLGVRSVRVEGVSSVDPAQVRAAAAIAPGTPLARLDTSAVEHRVDGLPAVLSARVSVQYPSTVVVRVVERSAVGYVSVAGTATLVDPAGVRFREVPGPPAGLPRLDLGNGDPAQAAAALSTVAGALTAAERTATSVIRAAGDQVSLALVDGRTVRWGTAERSADKARLLAAVLGQPGTVIDVSDPAAVVLR